jgi:hypothetical protein
MVELGLRDCAHDILDEKVAVPAPVVYLTSGLIEKAE